MIKNLRYAIAALAMMTCGATYAQDATEPESPTNHKIVFADVYNGIEGENATKTVVYLEKHPTEVDGIKITFTKGDAKKAPNYTIAKKWLVLYGGNTDNGKTEGNIATYTSDKYITSISMNISKASPLATVKANVGTIKLGGSNGVCPIWSNVDENGNVIDTKEVVFTFCSNETPTASDNMRVVDTQVYTLNSVPTGITSISTSTAKNGVRYNIAGQRVGNDFKGLVIENGQKKIVK